MTRNIEELTGEMQDLASSEDRLRAIYESEPECVKLLSRDMVLLEMNPAGLAMVEADRPLDAIGKDVSLLVDEVDRDAFIEVNRQAFDGKTGRLEFRITGLKGGRRWMETNVAPLRDKNGNVTAALSVTRDISGRKRDEELLMKLLEGTAASSGDGMFRALVRALAESLEAEYAFIGELDYKGGEVPTAVKTLSVLGGGQSVENFKYDLEGTPCQNVVVGGFCHYERDVASQFPEDKLFVDMKIESYLGVPLTSQGGRIVGILVVLDTKPMPYSPKTEAIFKIFAARAGAELDRMLVQQHERLLEEELRHSQKMESIGTLAGGIAHDFNNILGSIMGNAELAAMDVSKNDPISNSLSEIIKASKRAKGLISQILTFSRRDESQRSVVDLALVVREAAGMLRSTIPAGIELKCSVASDVPPVLAASDQIHQVIVNLCTNAWHALGTADGRIEVSLDSFEATFEEVQLDSQLREGLYVAIEVADNGAGMDEGTRLRIFDPFFTTKKPGKGTGLGLSVVHGIVLAHGGVLRVISESGKGSRFTVLLPAAAGSKNPAVDFDPAVSQGDGRHVLCVDDESALVQVLERMLTRQGFRVSSFTDPVEAIRQFSEAPDDFDAVITDVYMPAMSGLQVLEKISIQRPDMPLILSSGNFEDWVKDVAKTFGVRAFLFKPYTAKSLAKSLTSQLYKGRGEIVEIRS